VATREPLAGMAAILQTGVNRDLKPCEESKKRFGQIWQLLWPTDYHLPS